MGNTFCDRAALTIRKVTTKGRAEIAATYGRRLATHSGTQSSQSSGTMDRAESRAGVNQLAAASVPLRPDGA
jgi:hypothetical protein